jgi:hypothetical protein
MEGGEIRSERMLREEKGGSYQRVCVEEEIKRET